MQAEPSGQSADEVQVGSQAPTVQNVAPSVEVLHPVVSPQTPPEHPSGAVHPVPAVAQDPLPTHDPPEQTRPVPRKQVEVGCSLLSIAWSASDRCTGPARERGGQFARPVAVAP